MIRKLSLIASSVAALQLAGCAGFPSNSLKKLPPESLRSTPTAKTKVFSRWSVVNEEGAKTSNPPVADLNKKYFDDALSAADCCTVVDSPDAADLVIDGTALHESHRAAMIPALITGLSVYTIPSWITVNVHIKATAKSGGAARDYDLKDSLTMVQWLPMLLVLPFAENPFTAEQRMTENVFNNLVNNIKSDGLLK